MGCAAPPIEIDEGWLLIYYGVRNTSGGPIFRLGAAVLDRDDPSKVLKRSDIPILSPRERYERVGDIGNIVFCCVDSIQVRQLIWGAVADKVLLYCDGRMSAEVLRILTACDSDSRYHYPKTLFSAEEAYTGSCTAKTTIYCANIAAGLMISQFTRYLRHLPVDPDLQFNLLTSELTVAPSC